MFYLIVNVKGKYPTSSAANLKELKKLGCIVLHGVDVHTMSKHTKLLKIKFDRIVFNFPHAGIHYGFQESQKAQIK